MKWSWTRTTSLAQNHRFNTKPSKQIWKIVIIFVLTNFLITPIDSNQNGQPKKKRSQNGEIRQNSYLKQVEAEASTREREREQGERERERDRWEKMKEEGELRRPEIYQTIARTFCPRYKVILKSPAL